MDILYYSNHCKHSKKILHSCSRSNVGDKVSFICIDRRKIDHSTGKTIIPLENGTQVVMPPSLAFVPAMLLVNEKYRIIYGDAIIEYLRPMLTTGDNISQENREPESYGFGGALMFGLNPLHYMTCQRKNWKVRVKAQDVQCIIMYGHTTMLHQYKHPLKITVQIN